MGEDSKETIEVMVTAGVDSAVGYLRISRLVDKMTAKKILQLILPKVNKIKSGRTRKEKKIEEKKTVTMTERQKELLALQENR